LGISVDAHRLHEHRQTHVVTLLFHGRSFERIHNDPGGRSDEEVDREDSEVDPERQHPLGLLLGILPDLLSLGPLRGMCQYSGHSVGRFLARRLVLPVVWVYLVLGAHSWGGNVGPSRKMRLH
jgi:hypothetical protein